MSRHTLLKAGLMALGLLLPCAPAAADTTALKPPPQKWSFDGPFGRYDRSSLQRGFQVYREVCAACHGMNFVRFGDLAAAGGPGFDEAALRNIMASFQLPAGPNDKGETTDDAGAPLTRTAKISDTIPTPFANDQAARAANNGMLPQDLSLIVKARAGGADYIYALLTGYRDAPHGFQMAQGMSYNPYFAGRAIAMVPPLADDTVTFGDGTKATTAQEARDVTNFLAWASDPSLEMRHRIGLEVIAFLIWFAGLMALSCRKVWKDNK